MSGGWTYAIPKNSQNPDAAWEFIKLLTNQKNQTTFDINQVQLPVRSDVAADAKYLAANPTNESSPSSSRTPSTGRPTRSTRASPTPS